MSKIGTADIKGIMLGSTEISKAYLGSDVVYKKGDDIVLPDGYTRLNYVEFTGTQYINTTMQPNLATDDMEIDFAAVGLPTQSHICGTRTSTTQRVFTFAANGSQWRFGFANKTNNINGADMQRHVMRMEHETGSFYIDNVLQTTIGASTLTCNYRCAVGAIVASSIYYGHVKVYRFKYRRSGELRRDMIPCINPSNVVGMYDLVLQSFFGNSGTGDIVAGEPV